MEKPYKPEQINQILNPIVEKWFFTRFKEYSLPQLYGVMEIHSRNNILISAPTGATKTLTGFLSILNELIDSSEKGILEDKIYCVYISPLKALNNDIEKNLVEPLKEIEKTLAGVLKVLWDNSVFLSMEDTDNRYQTNCTIQLEISNDIYMKYFHEG